MKEAIGYHLVPLQGSAPINQIRVPITAQRRQYNLSNQITVKFTQWKDHILHLCPQEIMGDLRFNEKPLAFMDDQRFNAKTLDIMDD